MSETKKDTKSSWNKPKETSDTKSSKKPKDESANKFLNDLESKNLIIRVGGYSGHYIWKLIE